MRDSFLNGLSHLMKSWKELRSRMTVDLSDFDHLKMVTNFWSMAPLSNRVLNWDDTSNWPDPWKLIADMEFDESSISLAMKYTLDLSADKRWTLDRSKLFLIKDIDRHIQRIILSIDNKWLLNYEYNSVIDIEKNPQKFIIQQHYLYDGKMHYIIDNSTDMAIINSSDKGTE